MLCSVLSLCVCESVCLCVYMYVCVLVHVCVWGGGGGVWVIGWGGLCFFMHVCVRVHMSMYVCVDFCVFLFSHPISIT